MKEQRKHKAAELPNKLFEGVRFSRGAIIAGAGNIGTRLAMELPLFGISKITLIDYDRVEASNLNSCTLYEEKDIGSFKVDALANQLHVRFPHVEVVPLPKALNSVELAHLRDLAPAILLGAVDTRKARYELVRVAILLQLPLIDLGIAPAANQLMARAQATWYAMNGIDPLNSWSARDWDLMEQRQSCGKTSSSFAEKHIHASPISGMVAAALGASEVWRLLEGDASNIGFEILIDLGNRSLVRSLLPSSGSSPFSEADVIDKNPACCEVTTLGDLVFQAELMLGPEAEVVLNRMISTSFHCPQCLDIKAVPGPLDGQTCSKCGSELLAVEPVPSLSRSNLDSLTEAPVGCLGTRHDLLRLTSNDGTEGTWLEYREKGGKM